MVGVTICRIDKSILQIVSRSIPLGRERVPKWTEKVGHWDAVWTAGEAERAGRNWRCVAWRKSAAAELD
jgi:hypothetical protein